MKVTPRALILFGWANIEQARKSHHAPFTQHQIGEKVLWLITDASGTRAQLPDDKT